MPTPSIKLYDISYSFILHWLRMCVHVCVAEIKKTSPIRAMSGGRLSRRWASAEEDRGSTRWSTGSPCRMVRARTEGWCRRAGLRRSTTAPRPALQLRTGWCEGSHPRFCSFFEIRSTALPMTMSMYNRKLIMEPMMPRILPLWRWKISAIRKLNVIEQAIITK